MGPILYVNVHVVGFAFNVPVEFHKPLSDPISGERQTATTWQEVILGQGGEADIILSAVSRLTDTFIDEHLRVNEQACKQQD